MLRGTARGARPFPARPALLLAAPVTLVALLVPACGGTSASVGAGSITPSAATVPAAAPAAANVDVSIGEMFVKPAHASVTAGQVTFTVTNDGKVDHELVVVRTDKVGVDLLKGGEADETGSVGEISEISAGETKAITLALPAGTYQLLCNLPGHYSAGMYADITVS